MADPTPLHTEEMLQQVRRRFERLQGGGGGGTVGGNGGDGMDTNERMASIERAQIQTGMDLAYLRGKVEDMPTKEWVTTRLIWVVLAVGAMGALIEAAGRLIP